MIKIAHADRFTEIEMFEMFNVDMTLVAADPNTEGRTAVMHESQVRDKNRFLWRFKPTPKALVAKIDADEKADRLAAIEKRIHANLELLDGRADCDGLDEPEPQLDDLARVWAIHDDTFKD